MSNLDARQGWFPEVRAERFTLRPLRITDAPQVLAIHSRLDVIRWLGNPPYEPMAGLDQAREYIERALQTEVDDPFSVKRAIVPAEDGRMVGTVLVAPCVTVDGVFEGEYQLGWHLHPDASGRGYVTQAARLLADQAFTAGIGELVIDMYPDNAPSAALARRLQAREIGVIADPWYGGDGLVFRLTSRDLAWIETERLVLRRFTRDDLDFLAELFAIEDVARWSGSGEPRSRAEVRAALAGQAGRAGTNAAMGVFAVCPKSADGGVGDPIGQVALVPLPASAGVDRADVEIGWHLHPKVQGNGYATEAAQALVARARRAGLEEVFAVTRPDNLRSQAVCARLAMTDLGECTEWYDTTVRAFRLSLR